MLTVTGSFVAADRGRRCFDAHRSPAFWADRLFRRDIKRTVTAKYGFNRDGVMHSSCCVMKAIQTASIFQKTGCSL